MGNNLSQTGRPNAKRKRKPASGQSGKTSQQPTKLALRLVKGDEPDCVLRGNSPGSLLAKALDKLGIKLRREELSGRIEIKEGANPWSVMDDEAEAFLRNEIQERFVIIRTNVRRTYQAMAEFTPDKWNTAKLSHIRDNHAHAFEEFYKSLAPWDGVRRVDSLLETLYGLPDLEGAEAKNNKLLMRWGGRHLFLGPIQRREQPKKTGKACRLDSVVILVGERGIGKSSMLRALMPPGKQDRWYTDNISLKCGGSANARGRQIEAMHGCVIVEMAELAGVRATDVEELKGLTTRPADKWRGAYKKPIAANVRSCILVGTTSNAECIPNDPTGNRQFVVIRLGNAGVGNVVAYIDKWRIQLWAEAWQMYKRRVRADLPRSLYEIAHAAARVARMRNELYEGYVAELINEIGEEYLRATYMSMVAIKKWLKDNDHIAGEPNARELSLALQNAGFERDGNRRPVGWRLGKNADGDTV